MCENCRETKAELREELRELIAGEGEFYDQLAAAAVEEFEDEQLREDALDCIVAEAMGQRAAMIAQHCEGTPTHGMQTFVILGMWAHSVMQVEMQMQDQQHIRNLLGMGDN